MLIGLASQMEGRSTAVEMMKLGVSSLSVLSERSREMLAHVKPHLKHLHKVKTALSDATEKGKMAAQNLKDAISRSLSELETLYTLVSGIEKKKKTSCMWWMSKRFHLKKALQELEKVDSRLIALDASSLLGHFDDAMRAYEDVIELSKKKNRSCRTCSILQAACYAAVAILISCVRAGVVALQFSADIATKVSPHNPLADLASIATQVRRPLEKLISILNTKRQNLISTTQANQRLLLALQDSCDQLIKKTHEHVYDSPKK